MTLDTAHYGSEQLISVMVVGIVGVLLIFVPRVHEAILMGGDRRLSTSKTTAFVWLLVIAWMLLTLSLIAAWPKTADPQWLAGGPLSQLGGAYLALLGGPFAGLVGASAIVNAKQAKGSLQKPAVPTGDSKAHVSDIFSNDDGQTDLVDTQYLVFNVIAAFYVVALFAHHPALGFPRIPDQLMVLTLGPAGIYLTNKSLITNPVKLLSASPSTARVGQQILIFGDNLIPSGTEALPQIRIGGVEALVIARNDVSVAATVPPGLTLGQGGSGSDFPIAVTTAAGGADELPATNGLHVIPDIPKVRGMSTLNAHPRDTVSIFGEFLTGPPNLAGAPGGPSPVVRMNGQTIEPENPTDTQIDFVVPDDLQSLPVTEDVEVVRAGVGVSAGNLTVTAV